MGGRTRREVDVRWDQPGRSDRIRPPNQAPNVATSLYYIKPPFPSAGGCAAASAGRSGLSAPPASRIRARSPLDEIAFCTLRMPCHGSAFEMFKEAKCSWCRSLYKNIEASQRQRN